MLEMTLLIADDEEGIIENLEYDLKKTIPKIVIARNGAEALLKLKENSIDCVLTDINMPQKDGLLFAKEAREWGYKLPIIFLTAHGDDNLMKRALALGAFDFIDKPYQKDSLIATLTEAGKEGVKIKEGRTDASIGDDEFKKSYLSMIKS